MDINSKTPIVLTETASSAHLDGQNLIGVVSADFAMDLCIKKAENQGISIVSLKNANHFGIAGYYGLKALEKNLIGLAFTNTSPMVVPTRSKTPGLGTNPISFFANDFNLDMATSTVALGKIEMKRREKQPCPEGWGVNESGQVETQADLVKNLLPLGGAENTGGYKGYGLSAMVEILCGVLSGANFGTNIRRWTQIWDEPDNAPKANLGQCFICINPKFFNPNFDEDLSEYCKQLRGHQHIDGEDSVIIPGDKSRKNVEKMSEYIIYSKEVIDQIHDQIPYIEPMPFF